MHILYYFFSPWEWKQESCKAQRELCTPANWQNYSMNNSFPLRSFQVCIGIIVLYFFDGAWGPGLPSWLPRFPWPNFSWHREMHVTKTKRFRTAEMNSPMSDRSTGTNWTHKEGLNMSWAKQCVQVVTGSTVGVKAAPPILQQKAVLHQFFLEGGWWFWGGQVMLCVKFSWSYPAISIHFTLMPALSHAALLERQSHRPPNHSTSPLAGWGSSPPHQRAAFLRRWIVPSGAFI